MKIRYMAGVYTLVMLAALAVFYGMCYQKEEAVVDILYYNEQIKLIETGMKEGITIRTLEDLYECELILQNQENYQARLGNAVREGMVMLDLYKGGQYIGKAVWNIERESFRELREQLFRRLFLVCLFLIIAGNFVLWLVYRYVARPFQRLQIFSNEIAKGNLEMPLAMGKHNYFGSFTESFDIMREELKRAKENEYRANRSKKELVAGLSHDIKTPLSTIKATCEVMQVLEKNENSLEKITVISEKAEMIDQLVNNMFHATLEELEVLKVKVMEESSVCIRTMFEELKFYGNIVFKNDIPECLVWIDKLRLQQVVDNIINNSYKYAGTPISVSFQKKSDGIEIRIQDQGPGILEEELPMIAEKFYRGSNTKGKGGSGLGLYLSKIFMERMQGGIECYNENGFVVVLFVKKV